MSTLNETYRSLSALLALGLCLSSVQPAFALRPGIENATETGLEEALGGTPVVAAGLEEAAEAVEEVRRIRVLPTDRQAEALVNFLHDRLGAWQGRPEARAEWGRLPEEERNEFTASIDEMLERAADREDGWVTRTGAGGEKAPQIRWAEADEGEEVDEGTPALLGYSMNPTWDLFIGLRTAADGRRSVAISGRTGGSPANVARATAWARSRSRLVMMGTKLGEGRIDDPAVLSLEKSVNMTVIPTGTKMRTSLILMGPSGEEYALVSPGTATKDRGPIVEAEDGVEDALGESRPYNLAIGERVHGTQAGTLAGLIRSARYLKPGRRVYATASSGWDRDTWVQILAARPDVFRASLSRMMEVLRGGRKGGEPSPLMVARKADRLRKRSNTQEVLISLGENGEILVTEEGAWHIEPPREEPDTREPVQHFYRTGTNDTGLAHYRLARERGSLKPLDAAIRAVKAESWVMGQSPDNRMALPTMEEAETQPMPWVHTLWENKKAGLEESPAAVREAEARVSTAMKRLAEAADSKGLIVVPEEALGRPGALGEFLRRLEPRMASLVVLWGSGEKTEGTSWANQKLHVVREMEVTVLANVLADLVNDQGAGRVGMLEGAPKGVVEELSGLLRADTGIGVAPLTWDLRLVLQLLGVPQEVLGAVDLDQLAKDLLTLESA